jgi:L-alanine-DL-glutamate epimerase-like enolase superfamily enzyme
MIVRKVDIWHLKLAFRSPIKHNLATHQGSENLVIKVTLAEGGCGYGEGVPRAFVTGETMAASLAFMKEVLAPSFLNVPLTNPQELMAALAARLQALPAARAHPAACCALEMALLDAAGRTWNRQVADFIGPRGNGEVTYSAVLPMAPLKQLAKFFLVVKLKRMRFLKLKVGTDSDLQILKMAREKLGWDVEIRVDANAAWDAAEAIERIGEMKPYRISAVEQPVAKEDFQGLKKVQEAVGLPIVADESLCNEDDARRLIDLEACRIFNLRLSKCGGFQAAARIRRLADQAGILCQLGCHVGETSILSAAGRHFTLCYPNLAYVEGSFSPLLLSRDPVTRPLLFGDGGRAPALFGPGLGIEVLDPVLDELAISQETID